ncbi:MAG: 2-isopropylmalate synthase [Elusimicrobiota bacterium]
MNKILIFDTTLRDGEQSPGATLNTKEKIEIAYQLVHLGVDIIEAGFPISSAGDFEAVKLVAKQVKGPVIAGLSRATAKDIETCWQAVRSAQRPRIHTFLATSDIHLKIKLKKTRAEVLKIAGEAVKFARHFTPDVEFSAEDAVRSDFDFLCQVIEAVISAGATTVNIPDTVGYAIPEEYGRMIRNLKERVPNIAQAVVSVHCHNDLGLAVANSLAAAANGARQIECTINGLGERAGNAALEEVVMGLRTRKDFFGLTTNINTKEITKTSRLVSALTGIVVQPNKAVVGSNAFAHEAGIHQDGIIKGRLTYEIMTPQSVGITTSKLVLGKHSGRHALERRLKELGFVFDQEELQKIFGRFKELADKKKQIYDEDLELLVGEEIAGDKDIFTIDYLHTNSGSKIIPTATIRLKSGKEIFQEAACGDGPVDAAYRAVDKIIKIKPKLLDYSLRSVSSGKDAIGEVTVKLEYQKGIIVGRGSSTDIIEASVKAYLNALNRILSLQLKQKK